MRFFYFIIYHISSVIGCRVAVRHRNSIFVLDIDENGGNNLDKLLFEINYKLADGKRIRLDVSIEVKNLLAQADRQFRSQRRQERRRHTEYIDGLTDTTMALPQEDFADLLFRMDSNRRLYAAIEKLSDIQRHRVQQYYFYGLTYREIADLERVNHKTVHRSVARAIKNLKHMIIS